jgi:hypothetical protein
MCCTLQPSHQSDTIIYSGRASRAGQTVAVLAYQNQSRSYGANAMVLPFPTNEPMGRDNILDTRGAGHFLKDLDDSSKEQRRSFGYKGLIGARLNSADSVDVFESGSYTVVLASRPALIQDALVQVPANRRPTMTPEFLEGFEALYPGQPVAVCCWEGRLESEPLLWWYIPRDERLFFPTMDAHNGGPPVRGSVRVDHTLIWGNPTGPYSPHWTSPLPPGIAELMPNRMSAVRPNGVQPNGDMWATGSTITRIPL